MSKSVIIEIRSDIAESIERIGDYIPEGDRNHFVSSVVGIVVANILHDDNNSAALDAMDGLVTKAGLTQPNDAACLLGELMVLNGVFKDTYKHHDETYKALEEMLPNDLRVGLDEIFHVEISSGGDFLRIR
jgi:hypothetical protein